jgi:putative oxidoreductase
MTPVRFAARSLLGYTFVRSGLAALRQPEESAEAVAPLLTKLSAQFPQLPKDPALVVRATGAVQIAAGVALATGRLRRLSAVLLAASLVPSAGLLPNHPEAETPEDKARHNADFQKNLAILGGLVLAAVDTEGRPSLSWWARHAAKDARKAGGSAAKQARKTAKSARKAAKDKLPLS